MKSKENMLLLSKLNAMSVGPLWLLRARKKMDATDYLDQLSEVERCAICGEPWIQSNNENGSVMVVLASPITNEAQQKLLENCLAAAGWSPHSTCFSLHADCSSKNIAEIQASLLALQKKIGAQLPECVIVFGHSAAQLIDQKLVPGQINEYANTRLIVTYHPEEMINHPTLKAQVWSDLCLAKYENEHENK